MPTLKIAPSRLRVIENTLGRAASELSRAAHYLKDAPSVVDELNTMCNRLVALRQNIHIATTD